jgi:hypothetical protein
MTIKKEVSLQEFDFWGGAADFAHQLTSQELDTIEETLEDAYGYEIPTETEVNDIFWFEQDWVADILGTTVEEIYARE